jgi:MYXO-CTERM domain-containing protein
VATNERTSPTVDAADRTRHPLFSALIGLATLGVLLQGLWAGLFVHEGQEYQQNWVEVHALDGEATLALAALATVVAFVLLRRRRKDLVIGSAVFTVLLVLEAYIGGLIGDRSGLTAVHFPLALALMGLAVWLPLRATRRG